MSLEAKLRRVHCPDCEHYNEGESECESEEPGVMQNVDIPYMDFCSGFKRTEETTDALKMFED